jgi:hypothetical protein
VVKRRVGYASPYVPVARRGGYSTRPRSAPLGGLDSRHVRSAWSLPSFAFATAVCFVLAPAIDPSAAFAMTETTVTAPGGPVEAPQTITAAEGDSLGAVRNDFSTSRLYATAPAAGTPDPGSAQAIAYEMVLARGWDDAQYSCLVSLWEKESHWNIYAHNTKSGAYGIPQALPGEKMASIADDWQTNATTQITWGLGYIEGRYTNPCGAWTSSENRGWY